MRKHGLKSRRRRIHSRLMAEAIIYNTGVFLRDWNKTKRFLEIAAQEGDLQIAAMARRLYGPTATIPREALVLSARKHQERLIKYRKLMEDRFFHGK